MYTEKTPAAAPACAVSASACGGHSGSLPGSCGAMAFPFIAAQPDNPPRYNNKEAQSIPLIVVPFRKWLEK